MPMIEPIRLASGVRVLVDLDIEGGNDGKSVVRVSLLRDLADGRVGQKINMSREEAIRLADMLREAAGV